MAVREFSLYRSQLRSPRPKMRPILKNHAALAVGCVACDKSLNKNRKSSERRTCTVQECPDKLSNLAVISKLQSHRIIFLLQALNYQLQIILILSRHPHCIALNRTLNLFKLIAD